MKIDNQPLTEVILACKSIHEESRTYCRKKGYRVIYMDEASFYSKLYLAGLM
jgi:hypothetical protein